jgi:hypothetical protein
MMTVADLNAIIDPFDFEVFAYFTLHLSEQTVWVNMLLSNDFCQTRMANINVR